jgi:hypothetical protein
MNNVHYDFMFRLASKEIDDEITRWTEEAFNSDDMSDYWQMLGIAQGLEKAQKILERHIKDNQNPGVWGDSK